MRNPTKVLVVDDELKILNFTRIGLSFLGYEVLVTTSGEEALSMVASEKPDIMVLDIVMTPLDGFAVLKKLRDFSTLPVIVFSSMDTINDLALEEGANGFIAKPFTADKLAEKIEVILDNLRSA